jgi:hypothetical protein
LTSAATSGDTPQGAIEFPILDGLSERTPTPSQFQGADRIEGYRHVIDAILSSLKLAIDSIDKLGSLAGLHRKSGREELCYALYRLFETVNEIIVASESVLAQLDNLDDPAAWEEVRRGQEAIAREISRTWKPLNSVVRFMEVAEPGIAEAMRRSFGPKLLVVRALAELSSVLAGETSSRSKTVRILTKLDAGRFFKRYSHRELTLDRLNEIEQVGVIHTMSCDLAVRETLDALIQQGRTNVSELKALKRQLREFMVKHFKAEEFFFKNIRI